MRCSQLNISTFALIIGLPFFISNVLGQTVSSSVVDPCAEEITTRPTLKQRQPAQNVSSPLVSYQQRSGQTISSHEANEPQVRFEGLHALTEAEVLKLFSESQLWVRKDQMSTLDVIARAVTLLKESLEGRGYLQANVEARQDWATNTVNFLVSEGRCFAIREVRFEGNRVFSSQELAARMSAFLAKFEQPKSGYNAEIFDVCRRLLTYFVRSQGYLQARFGEPKKELTEGGLVITVPVEEGILYRLGEIKIDGAHHVTEQQAIGMLGLNRGDIANGEAIAKWLFEDLKELYGEIGYIEYTAEPVPYFKVIDKAANEGIVDFKVWIEEGKQFKIRSIKFEGSNVSDQDLGKLLLIRAGDIFNNRFFEKSVQQLNDTTWFETIDKDKDADFRTDKEADCLDITLRLKRVQTP